MRNKKVVITGIGPLSSAGIGKESLWKNLVSNHYAPILEKTYLDHDQWDEFFLHKIESFDIENFNINKSILNSIRDWKEGESVTDLEYLLASVKLALDDACLDYDPENNNIACVISHENPGLEQYFSKLINFSYDTCKKQGLTKFDFAQQLHNHSIKSAYELQTFTVLFHVMKVFGLHGYSQFLNNACSSGLHAFENASQIIKSDRSQVVVVAAADHPRIYKYLWFKELGMYEQDGKMKPFDKNARGLVFGDGGAGFILEEYEHAQNRGARIYAEYCGGGFTQEAWKTIFPNVGSIFYTKAIQEALTFSEMVPKDVDAICAHGAAHPVIDRYEAGAIQSVFGKKENQPAITALKPYVGHNLGGNNLLETAILLLGMERNILLPLVNTETIHPKISLNLQLEMLNKPLTTIMKTCCAFAGFNAAAIFKKHEALADKI